MVWPWSIPAGDLDGLALAHAPLPAAVGAGLVDDAAGAPALLAGAAAGEHAHGRPLLHLHLSAAVAVGAYLRCGARLTAAALAGGALLAALHGHVLFAAEGRLLERDGHAGADALAPLGRVGVPPLLAAESAAEEAAEDVAQIAEVEAARAAVCAACARPVAGVNAREAELVVPRLLLRIAEHLVGLVDLLELLLGLLVAGVHVRVVLPRQLFVCFFDLVLRCALADAENLIIISLFLCHGRYLLNTTTRDRYFLPLIAGYICLTCSDRRHRLPCSRRRSTADRRWGRRRAADRPCWGRPGAPAAGTASRSSCRTAGSAPRWPP